MNLQDIRSWAVNAQPVFLCGLERSGTSILQVSLARHPTLYPVKDVYETFVFLTPRHALMEPPPSMMASYLGGRARSAEFKAMCDGLQGPKSELSDADLIRAFFHFCSHTTYAGRRPLEKTPGHVRKLKRILELFPRARVIVCTRDPVSVVASYRKRLQKEQALGRGRDEWGWLDRTPEQLVAHFEAITRHVEDAQRRWPGQIFVAPYDWITDDPETALRQICDFARLEFVPELLTPKDVPGRKVDELLSKPITKREPEDDLYVDAPTQAMIRAKTAWMMPLWQTAGLVSTKPV